MNKGWLIKQAENTVERLILQYKEYVMLTDHIQVLETEKLEMLARDAKEKGVSLSVVMASANEDHAVNRWLSLLKTDVQQVSDEMTFANPLIWMMYKDKAYKGTSTEIKTWKDFKKHCEPEAYICGIRYRFLKSHFASEGKALDTMFADDSGLMQIYQSREILDLCLDIDFMEEWKKQEYRKTDDKVNKWGLKQ